MSGRLRSRILWGALLLLVLGGPSPGSVGSCGDDSDPLLGPADVVDYCSEREQMVCIRRFERGEIDLVELTACRYKAIAVCQNRTFLPGCVPTEREAQACLNALHSRSTLDRTVLQLKPCRELCDLDPDKVSAEDLLDGGMP